MLISEYSIESDLTTSAHDISSPASRVINRHLTLLELLAIFAFNNHEI